MVHFAAINLREVYSDLNGQEIRAAIALAMVYVLRMLGLFMVMPVLAVRAMDYPDYSPLLVGLAIGGYGLTQAMLQIPMGMLSDRWGRKPVIFLGLTVFAIGSFIASQADSMAMMAVGRILQGAGAIAGAIMALATDVSRETQRAKVMAIIGIAIGMSFYIAVLLGPWIDSGWGIQGIYTLTGILALVCIPIVKWGVPTVSTLAASGDMLPQKGSIKRLFTSSQLWRLNVSVMILHLFITMLFIQLPVLLTSMDISLDHHWTLYLPVLGLSVVLMATMMRMAPGQAPKSILMLSIVLMAVCAIGMNAFAPNWWGLFILVTLFFTGFNYLEANLPALVSSIAPAGEKGSAMGVYASFQFFGAFLGGVISGAVAQEFGLQALFVISLALVAIWLWVVSGLRQLDKFKRVMLDGAATANIPLALDNLAQLTGVQEVHFAKENKAVYLKVDSEFKLDSARQILANQ